MQAWSEAAYALLGRTHRARWRVFADNGSGSRPLPRLWTDGSAVTFDMDAAPTHQLSMTLVDPDRRVSWLADSGDDSLYFCAGLQVLYEVWDPEISNWWAISIFNGNIAPGSERSGHEFTIHAKGKEMFGLDPFLALEPITMQRGEKCSDAINAFLEAMGETAHLSFPGELTEPVTLEYLGEPWKAVQEVATRMNKQIYYNGAGVLQCRQLPRQGQWTVKTGQGPRATISGGPPNYTFGEGFRNHVIVESPDPCGGEPIVATATSSLLGPFHPVKLGRNGARRDLWLIHREEVEGLDQEMAQARADDLLDDFETNETSVEFSTMPLPHLDPGDMLRINEPAFPMQRARLRQGTIPAKGAMTIGGLRRESLGRHK